MPDKLIHDPKHWHDRANEARAIAEQIDDPKVKLMMLGIVDGYELLAGRSEQRLRDANQKRA